MAVTRTDNVITCTAANDAVAGNVYISGITFTGALAGDQVVIKVPEAGTGNELYNVKVGANTSSIVVPLPVCAAGGFKITTLSANGEVKLYIR